jgi:(p)ppGpp synthase/HD superfamily hydrolase
VVQLIYPELTAKPGEEIDAARAVVGLSPNQTFERARCCQPVPGERIVGISYPGKGVWIHAIACPVLEELQDQTERWVDLHWHSGNHPAAYPVSFDMTISNDAGVLGRICSLIGEQKANISDLHFLDRKQDFYRLIIDVDLRDVEHMHAVRLALEADSDVATIRRHRDLALKP